MDTVMLKRLTLSFILFFCTEVIAETPKILFINSYHQGYEWSDGVERGMEQALGQGAMDLKKFYMDTKRKRKPEQIKAAALEAKQLIDEWQPDVVITADDNAAKFIIQPFYKDSDIPFVFCGVNWDASIYGFPYSNVTGMEEVSLIKSLQNQLRDYAQGNKIGLISIDAFSGKRNANHFEKNLGRNFDQMVFVKTYDEWKQKIVELQKSVDMVILENPKGIDGWENKKGLEFLQQNTLVPIGTTHVWLAPYALITIAKIPEEQGRWAGLAAQKILAGKSASSIPIEKNKQGNLYINFALSEKLGVVFKPELIETATIIR